MWSTDVKILKSLFLFIYFVENMKVMFSLFCSFFEFYCLYHNFFLLYWRMKVFFIMIVLVAHIFHFLVKVHFLKILISKLNESKAEILQ